MSVQQLKGFAWLCLALVLTIGFATGLPFLVSLIPWSVEKRAPSFLSGRETDACYNPQGDVPFQKIIHRLYPIEPHDESFPLTVQVIHGETVNAFATLGGHIYVYDGLLQQAESADELAGILAHEIEHVRRRHILQGIVVRLLTTEAFKWIFLNGHEMGPQAANLFLNMRFSRGQEAEADDGGLERLQKARISPLGFEHFFERAKTLSVYPSILSDHPTDSDRARRVQRYASSPSDPVLTPDEWRSVQTMCR